MEDSNKTLVELIYEMREEIGMPRLAVGDKVFFDTLDGRAISYVLGYPTSIQGIVLVETNQFNGLSREYIQHQDWVREVEKQLGKVIVKETHLFWSDENELYLILEDD